MIYYIYILFFIRMVQNSDDIKKQYDSKYMDSNFRTREFELYQKYVKLLLEHLDKKSVEFDSLIDLGCGDGIKTQAIAQFFKTTLGIDLSRSGINQAQLMNKNHSIDFKCMDMLDVVNEKFSCISAFGFSYFNTKDINELVYRIQGVYDQFAKPNSFLILSSFTDFSGDAPTGWVKHSEEEIRQICTNLTQKGFQVATVFPHRIWSNYVRFGFKNFIFELGKRFLVKNNTFFIIVYK